MLTREVTAQQAAELTGKTVTTIHNWIKTGRIDKVRWDGPRRVWIDASCLSELSTYVTALRQSYEVVDSTLDVAIVREDLYEIQKLRKASKLIAQHWDDCLSVSLEKILQSITVAAAHQPSVYYARLIPAIKLLTEVSNATS